MAYGVSTEWEDIQRKLGNLPEKAEEPSQEEILRETLDQLEQNDPHTHLSDDQLEALEDATHDNELQKIRQQRLEAMRRAAARPVYSDLIEISKQDYEEQVTNASKNTCVILFLYQSYIPMCELLNSILLHLAKKFPHQKFVKIQATRCIENFQDSHCPALIVYKEGSVFKSLLSCAQLFGGSKMTVESVEWGLAREGVLETELEENPLKAKTQFTRKGKREDLSDSDEDDREYMSNQIRRIRRV